MGQINCQNTQKLDFCVLKLNSGKMVINCESAVKTWGMEGHGLVNEKENTAYYQG